MREGREGWDRAGVVIGLVVALAIMWGALAISIVSDDDGGARSSGTGKLIYEQPDPAQAAEDDDAGGR